MATTPQTLTTTPLVSILMLTYNRANYIDSAIKSVLTQSYLNFELIILDDGSTDNTATIVSNFTDPRILYINSPENLGLAVRRKESLTYAKGKYIAVLDSDDYWISTDKLSKQVNFLETDSNCVVVGTFISIVNEQSHEIAKTSYLTTNEAIRSNILWRNQFAHSSVLMRKSVLDKTNGYLNLAVAEDLDLFLQLGCYGTFANIPEYLVAYRIHEHGTSKNKYRVVSFVLKVLKFHKNNYPGYFQARLKFNLYRIWFGLVLPRY